DATVRRRVVVADVARAQEHDGGGDFGPDNDKPSDHEHRQLPHVVGDPPLHAADAALRLRRAEADHVLRRPRQRRRDEPEPLQPLEPHARAERIVPVTASVRTATAIQYTVMTRRPMVRQFASSQTSKRSPTATCAWSAPRST